MLFLVLGCTNTSDAPIDTVDSGMVDTFCTSYEQAGANKLEDGSGDATSGHVKGQFIQGVSDDPRDPQFVAFVDYLIENVDVGGQATRGRTDQDGAFAGTLGGGNWLIKTSGHQGSYSCGQETTFAVTPGKVTVLCIDMNCQ